MKGGVYRMLTYEHACQKQDKNYFYDKGKGPEKESDDCSREEEQDDGVHRDDPLVVKQAYSCEQDQRYRLSADFFDELQFHVLYNFKYE